MKKISTNRATRAGSRLALKLRKKSPTILVVAGVVGMGASAVMAAKASKKAAPVVETHKAEREEIGIISKTAPKQVRREQQRQVIQLYMHSGARFARVYGPAITVGALSAGSILYGHNILRGRHLATMAAYSGLSEQFSAYRDRVRRTLGDRAEQDIYRGAHGEYYGPDGKGEYPLGPVFADDNPPSTATQPWFDENNSNHRNDPEINKMWLTGVQNHMNRLLQVRGHLFLNEVMDALNMPRTPEGQQLGWVYSAGTGDDFVDFGFLTEEDPHTVAFRNGEVSTVRLNLNVDGIVMDLI